MKKVEVLDRIMGSGKTTKIVEWIENNPDERYIYISPLLSEIDEETGRLSDLGFLAPNLERTGTKSAHLYELLAQGKNVSCTHSLYKNMTKEHFRVIRENEYIVIIDEEIQMLDLFTDNSKADVMWLKEKGHIVIDESQAGLITWKATEELGRDHSFEKMKKYCDEGRLFAPIRTDGSGLMVQLPPQLFEAAKRTILLTYIFEGNVLDCFLRLRGFTIVDFTEVEVPEKSKAEIKALITLHDVTRRQAKLSLSSTWYEEALGKDIREVSNLIRATCRKYTTKASDVMWTLPSDRVTGNSTLVSPKGFKEFYTEGEFGRITHSCWVASNARATNRYKYRWMLVHAYSRFPLTHVENYLSDYKFPIDRDVFAVSELVQWVWRSRIRDDKPIVLCIVPKRMRDFFNTWLNN